MDSAIVIVGLFVVILAEIIFTFFVLEREKAEKERLLDELAKANTAISAKSAQEYAMMRAMDNVPIEKKKNEPEGVDASELSDDEYDEFLKKQLKVG